MDMCSLRTCCSTYIGKSYPLLYSQKTRINSYVKLRRRNYAQSLSTMTNSLHSRVPTFSVECSQDSVSETDESRVVDEKTLFLEKRARGISSDLKGTCLFFLGMTTSMKTTVAKKLSELLAYYFFDSENLVEQASGGASGAWKLKEEDEEGFRDAESEVLRQLSSMTRLVVSTGDGAVVRFNNLGYMRHGITIWLDVPLEALAKEMVAEGVETQGPLGQITAGSYSQALTMLTKLFDERQKGYATADVKISLQKIAGESGYEDVFSLGPTVIADEVLKRIGKLLRYKQLQEAAAAPEIQQKVG